MLKLNENDFEQGAESITGNGMHLTMSSFDAENIKCGDIYICSRSSVEGRKDQHFEIKRKIDIEALLSSMAYGDHYDRIYRKPK